MDMLRNKNIRTLSELEQITYQSQVYALPIEQHFQTGFQGRAAWGCAVLYFITIFQLSPSSSSHDEIM